MYYQRIQPYIAFIRKYFPQHPNLQDMGLFADENPDTIRADFRSWCGRDIKEFIQHLTFILARVHRRTPSDTYSFPDYQPAIFLHSTPVITHLHILWTDTVFGRMLLAATDHGLAAVLFDNEDDTHITTPEKHAQHLLKTRFPKAKCSMILNQHISDALAFFSGDATVNLHLHVNTTAFRVQVYEALIKIPPAKLRTYTETARFIGRPRAVRAVGNAVASNPISLIIPCHRIVPASGGFGNYFWGSERKMALLGWEAIAENRYIATAIQETTTKNTPL